ncbi:MAG: hypothetical protein IPN63_07905 [Gammaproteobacteria bacterium]|nr:hypothetical protein [Gammaproteobacteria bacterium]
MSLIPWAPSQWTDDLGRPLAFGKLYLYQAGTLIPKATYQDAAHTVAHTFPIVLDATGRENVWLIDDEAYDLVVHDANDNVLRSVLGIVTNGGGGAPAPATGTNAFEVESFKYSEGGLVRDEAPELWSNASAKGCFCWITPCEGWETIKYIRTTFSAVVFMWVPRFAIWGWTGATEAPWELLADDEWTIASGRSSKNTLDIDLATPGYKWIKVATDPGPLIAPEWVKQMGVVYPPAVNADPFPPAAAFIGTRTNWLVPFGTDFPVILADDPRYLVTKWIALGVES